MGKHKDRRKKTRKELRLEVNLFCDVFGKLKKASIYPFLSKGQRTKMTSKRQEEAHFKPLALFLRHPGTVFTVRWHICGSGHQSIASR